LEPQVPSLSRADVKLDPSLEARLRRLANRRRRSTDRLVREAIAQYVEREEARERLHSEALAAWEEYQSTGQHLTAEEVEDWLARLEAGENREPPQPHD
jgi:predicted transcriptional regulator